MIGASEVYSDPGELLPAELTEGYIVYDKSIASIWVDNGWDGGGELILVCQEILWVQLSQRLPSLSPVITVLGTMMGQGQCVSVSLLVKLCMHLASQGAMDMNESK